MALGKHWHILLPVCGRVACWSSLCWSQYSICGETRGGQQCIFDVFLTKPVRGIWKFGGGGWEQGRHFNFFLGDQNVFLFFNATGLLKNWKKQHFICSNLTLFVVPFFLFSLYSLFFLFFLSFFLFFLFFFFLGGRRPPSPPKWCLWLRGTRRLTSPNKSSTGWSSLLLK